jgi:hypothetical protein
VTKLDEMNDDEVSLNRVWVHVDLIPLQRRDPLVLDA